MILNLYLQALRQLKKNMKKTCTVFNDFYKITCSFFL